LVWALRIGFRKSKHSMPGEAPLLGRERRETSLTAEGRHWGRAHLRRPKGENVSVRHTDDFSPGWSAVLQLPRRTSPDGNPYPYLPKIGAG
jgi:hypothetical protein